MTKLFAGCTSRVRRAGADAFFHSDSLGNLGTQLKNLRRRIARARYHLLGAALMLAGVVGASAQASSGSANFCPSGATPTPPCSTPISVNFHFTSGAGTTVNSIVVVTQGYTGLDFTDAQANDNCVGATVSSGNTCLVNVAFTPQAVGLRLGAVELLDSTNNVLATQFVYGIGQGPVAAFSPLQSFGRYLGGPSGNAPNSIPLNQPKGVAVDAQGNIFIADTANHQVLELQGNATTSVYNGGSTSAPQGLAIDGAGNLYVADADSPTGSGGVWKVPANGGPESNAYADVSGSMVTGVAVDGSGNLYVADYGQGAVFEVPVSGGAPFVIYEPATRGPVGVAVDAAGNVFVADPKNGVMEAPAGCNAQVNTCENPIGAGWHAPQSVAVDAAGDVFVADTNSIVEVPPSCASVSCEISIASNVQSYGLTVDPNGVVDYVSLGSGANSGALQQILQQFYGLNFGYMVAGFDSTAQTVMLQNVGNQPMNIIGPGVDITDPNFVLANTSTCPTASGFLLAAGATCNAGIEFGPQASQSFGPKSGDAIFTNNSLNNPSSSQDFSLNGISIGGQNGGNLIVVADVGSGTGAVTDNDLLINCVNGNSASSCAGSYAPGSQVTLTATPTGTSTFQGWGGACSSFGTSPQCTLTMNTPFNVTAIFQQESFGGVSVCAGGNASGCAGSSLAVTFNFPAGATFNTVQVVTQGAAGLDFQQASGGNCTPGTFPANSSCSVNVAFTPLAPGMRQGAVQLLHDGVVVASQFIFGIGQGPEVAFGPATTYVSTSNITYSRQVTAVPNLNSGTGMTTDAAGNLYQITGTTLQKLAPPYTGTPTTLATGFTTPKGVAIDGAGNLYIADSGATNPLGGNGEVFELAPGCASASCGIAVYSSPPPHPGPAGVAVDGLGNVFVADDPLGVFEVPAGCASSSCQIALGNLWFDPVSVALDASGNLFVADSGRGQVIEVPAGSTTPNWNTPIGTGFNNPNSVTVDPAGDVIVADPTLTVDGSTDAGGLVEIPVGCNQTASCQILLWSGGAADPFFVTTNAAGQIFIATDGIPVVEINQSQTPSVAFGNVNVGSPAGPIPVTIQNIGNQDLTGTVLLNSQNFSIDASSNCSGLELVAGASCTEGFDFMPTSATGLNDTAVVNTNSLNLNPGVALISLTGTGTSSGPGTFTLALTALGSGSGTVTDNAAFNCTITNGTASGSCSLAYTSGAPVTLTAAPAAPSLFLGWGGACASFGTATQCTLTMSGPMNVTADFVQGDFGSVNVCAGGNTSGCAGVSQTVTFSFTSSVAVSQIRAVTQGATGLDFSAQNSGSCINNFTAGQSCTVNVTFTPTAPGLRMGAIELLDDGGNLIATQLISGIGQGSAIAFGPGAQTTVQASGISLTSGVAVDASGNVYISTQDNQVVKVTPGGVQTTVPATGLNYPYDIAVDGAGDVFLVDNGNNRVVEVTPAGVQTTVPATGLSGPTGVAVDAAGDVFITDNGNNRVVKVTASGVQTTVPTTGISGAYWPAVDAAGDLFFSDNGNHRVVEVSAGGVQSTVPATGLLAINGVAVDAAGDVFISDQLLNEVVEVTPSGVQSTLPFTGLNVAAGVAVDWSGDVFVADHQNNRVVELVRSQAPAITFPNTNVGSSSGPAPVTLQNVGNQNLTGTASLTSTQNFSFDGSSDCGGIELIPGASCTEAFDFSPSTSGPLSTTAQISDNSLNGAPATQTISLTGTGVGVIPSYTLFVSDVGSGAGTVTDQFSAINCSVPVGNSTPCSASYQSGTQITLTATPSGGASFLGWGGACASFGTSSQCTLTMNASMNVTASFGEPSFGSVNACTPGPSVPPSCSSTQHLTFTSPTTLANVTYQVVTQGTPGLDFSLGQTCGGMILANTACGINVTFTPQAPGLRLGAVKILNGGVLVATLPISGIGQGALAAFTPFSTTVVPAGTLIGPKGVLVDAAGDLFVSDYEGHKVVEVGPSTSNQVVTIAQSPQIVNPQGLAMDGAGNLYVADTGIPGVTEIPWGCTSPSCQQLLPNPMNLSGQFGVSVDAQSNVFVSAYNQGVVVEVPANGGPQFVVYGGNTPIGTVEDAAGNLFVADSNNQQVVKVPAGCSLSSCYQTIGSGWSSPNSVALDAAGDLYVVDGGPHNKVVEFPAGCITNTCSVILASPSTPSLGANFNPYDAVVDSQGNVYIGDHGNQRVDELPQSQPPTLDFGSVNVNARTSDIATSIQNIGNQTLTGSAATTAGFVFDQVNSNCTSSISLLPGVSCFESFYAQPQTLGTVNGSATLSDNSLNGTPSTQVIPLTVVSQGFTLTVAAGVGNGNGAVADSSNQIQCTVNNGVAGGTCSGAYASGTQVTLSETGLGGSTFTGWGNACANSSTNPTCTVTMNSSLTATAGFNASAANDIISVTLLGSGGGTVTDNSTGINCTLGNGSSTGTCTFSYQAGSHLTLTETPAPGSIFSGWGAPCSGTSSSCSFSVDNTYDVDATFVQQSFGNVNVCPPGQGSGACSQNLPVNFNFAEATNLGVIQVVTQGATGLDFTLADAGTCTGTITAGHSCSANVTFTPLAPGLREGAVTLYDNNGNLVATQFVYGNAQAPLAAFGPGTNTTVNLAGNAIKGATGVAVDAAGDLFIGDTDLPSPAPNAHILKVASTGVVTTVGSGWQYPQGLAVDGAGNLFVADNNLNEVVEIPAGCVDSSCQKVLISEATSPYKSELGIVVDGGGNVFFSDFLDGEVVEIPSNGSTPIVVYNPAGSNPVGLAVDAAGDLFIADHGLKTVTEIPAGCANSGCWKTIGTGWQQPDSVSVDAAGDVYVADAGNISVPTSGSVVEVPASCNSIICQIVLASGIQTVAATVDSLGNVFISNEGTNQIDEIEALPPSLNFALTDVGSTSTDSPQIVTLQNIGNQLLTGTATFNSGTSFSLLSQCGPTLSLLPGFNCSLNFGFSPQSTGYLTGSAIFSDNTMNLSLGVSLQTINLTGIGGLNGQATTTAVPNVVGLTQPAAGTTLTSAGLIAGSVSTASSSVVPSGSVIASNPPAGTQVAFNSSVKLLVSSGPGLPPTPNPLSLMNNYFVTGDYASGGITLRGASVSNGMVTGSINIPSSSGPGFAGVPNGADLIDGFLYWTTIENSASPSATNAIFLGYPITGQQIGVDQAYTDPATSLSGTLRVYRADVNTWFQNETGAAAGIRMGSGSFSVSLPGPTATNGIVLTEGASLVVIYRVLSQDFKLKAVVIYDGSATPLSSTTQDVQGFYDALGGGNASGEVTTLYADSNGWNNTSNTSAIPLPDRYDVQLNGGAAYAAVILSTLVNNPDNDGILGAWKTGPPAADFHGGQPGYYDVKTGAWIALPGAQAGHKDLFVQLDYMCAKVLSDGTCDPNQENLFPSPDSLGNDPLIMVQNAFQQAGVTLHLQIGNAVQEDTCNDSAGQLCQFPGNQGTGVVGWKNSLEFSKVWPRNFSSCASGGDCSPRFAYGQKDSYHYVLFGHSLAIPAWNTRYGTLTSIAAVAGGTTTIGTTDRGTGANACPSRITISGIQGMPGLNGVYDTTSCPDSSTMIISTPTGVASWNYPNATLPEPVIGITSGTVTSISGYSDLGGADSAVTLGLWATFPNQNMSKKATVIAGTLFHELGHTIGLSHGGLYYNGNYIPTFEANCKPNYQSIMNYLFQLDGVGLNSAIAYSNQTLNPLTPSSLGSVGSLVDANNPANLATFSTSSWYVPTAPSNTTSPAQLHCDGTPLGGDVGYRVTGTVDPIVPAWTNGQNITFDGQASPTPALDGYNDVANLDLRQVGATGGQLASLASVLSFSTAATPLDIAPGGSVSVSPGGSVTLANGGSISVNGGSVTVPSGGMITGGGMITFGTGGSATISGSGKVTPGTNGIIGLPSGGTVTLGGGGSMVSLGANGTITLVGGGTVTLGGGGSIILPAGGGTITIPSTGGTYLVPANGTVMLNSAGTITLGGGGAVTLGGGGTITLGGGGAVTLGGGGAVTLGGGGTITLGGGGVVTLGGGGTVTLGGGGVVTLGGGGVVTLGGGGVVTLGGGGTVTLGGGGAVTLGGGGTVTLGGGGTVTLGGGGVVTLGGGGTDITIPSGGTISGGGAITMNAAGVITLGGGGDTINGVPVSAGTYNVSAGGVVTLGGGGTVTLGGGGVVTLGGGGAITLGGGGTITLGGGGVVTLGGGGVVTLGGGGAITLGGGGAITLGGGGAVTLGGGGVTSTELNYDTANSIVRPPTAPTETTTTQGVVINWTAPGFGVVQTYTIYRSVNGGTPVIIGSVSGQNDNPPATTFTDTNPPVGDLSYTISTALVPDLGTNTERQSPPSMPAAVTYNQTIVLGTLQSSYMVSQTTVPVTATITTMAPSTDPVPEVMFAAAGSCSIVSGSQALNNGTSSATVSLDGTGSCTITASQSGSTNFNPADPVSASFTILPKGSNLQSQTINFSPLPNVVYGGSFSLSATSSSGETVTFSTSGPCNTSGGTTGVGLCSVTASVPGDTTFTPASKTQSFSIIPAVLTVAAGNITIAYGQQIPSLTGDYNVAGFVNGDMPTNLAVISGAPLLTTTATSTSAPGTYPISVSTGSLAAPNYDFLFVPATLTIQQGPTITVSPTSINFGSVTVNSITIRSVTVTNNGTAAATISTPIISVLGAGNSNEFVVVSLCPSSLAVGKSCTITVSFVAGAYYNTPQTATLKVMDNAPGSPQLVALTAIVLAPQTITFTTNPPSSAAYNSSFPVAATASSGLAVTFTSSGACTNSGATYTMTSGTGTCSVIANQAGNASYAPASQVTKTVTATPAAQTITFTTNPPSSAGYKTSFPVAATASSGLAVTFASSGSCTNSGATYTMTSSTGTCSVIANQAGNSNYSAAPKVTKTVTATVAPQAITFTTNAPASAAYKTSFTVAATGGGSGNPVTFTSSGSCTNSGATYTMTSATGTCSVIANQAGNSNYAAAPKVTQTVNATQAPQAITFTTKPPASAAYKTSFTVAATGGGSGNAVTFTSSGACTNSGATYTMTSGTGSCTVIANQAGNSNYLAAPQVTEPPVSAVYSIATLTPASLSFGTVSSGKSSSAKTATLTNTGSTPLIISSIGFTGAFPNNFTQTNTCPGASSSLAAGKSCTISVIFKSSGTAVTANLAVTDNTQAGTQTVAVSGN